MEASISTTIGLSIGAVSWVLLIFLVAFALVEVIAGKIENKTFLFTRELVIKFERMICYIAISYFVFSAIRVIIHI